MKYKLKNYLKLGILLIGVSLFIVSCQKDDDLKSNTKEETKKFTITPLFSKDLENKKEIINKINDINKKDFKRTSLNKTITDSISGIEIKTEYANYIEYPDYNYHSYTFAVVNTPVNGGLENVFLSLQADGSYKEFLAHYNVSQEEIDMMNTGQFVNLENKITITELSNSSFSDATNNKVYYDNDTMCWVNTTWIPGSLCSEGVHNYWDIVAGIICVAQYQPTQGFHHTYNMFCNQDSGNNNSTTPINNPSNGTQSGAGGTSTPPQDETVVVTCNTRGSNCLPELDPIREKNCEELQKLLDMEADPTNSSPSTLKEVIADLKTGLPGEYEEGYELKHTSSDLDTSFDAVPPNRRDEGKCEYKVTINLYGGIHLHVNNANQYLDSKYDPMFSHGDIFDLIKFQQNYNNPSDPNPPDNSLFVHLLVTYQGTYAIKIKNPLKFQELNNILSNRRDKRKFERRFDQRFLKHNDTNGNPAGSPSDYETTLLKYINHERDLGISLFKTVNDANGVPTNWEEITIVNGDTQNSNLVPKPCN